MSNLATLLTLIKKEAFLDSYTSDNAVALLKDGRYFSSFQHNGRVKKDWYKHNITVTSVYNRHGKLIDKCLCVGKKQWRIYNFNVQE